MIRWREVSANGLQQNLKAPTVNTGTYHDRNNVPFNNMGSQSDGNLFPGKPFFKEMTFRIFFAGLSNGLNEGIPGNGRVFLGIIRNLTLFIIT